jgi:hypothetical protein
LHDAAINSPGTVAVTVRDLSGVTRFDENFNQFFSINTSDGGSVMTVAETSPGGYASFREPSLNDLGGVAFTADVQPDPNVFITTQGVFTGPDPRVHKVLQAGDRYE